MLTTVGNWHKQENINFPPSRSLQSFVFVQYDMQDVIEQQMLMTNANSANHWALEMIENELTPPLNQNKFNMNTTLNILIHNKDIFPACTDTHAFVLTHSIARLVWWTALNQLLCTETDIHTQLLIHLVNGGLVSRQAVSGEVLPQIKIPRSLEVGGGGTIIPNATLSPEWLLH